MLRPTENLTDIWPLVTGGNMYNMMVHLDWQAQYEFSVLHILYIVGNITASLLQSQFTKT